MENLGDTHAQALAGAVSTAPHGSGIELASRTLDSPAGCRREWRAPESASFQSGRPPMSWCLTGPGIWWYVIRKEHDRTQLKEVSH